MPPVIQEQARRKLNIQESKSKYGAQKTSVDGHRFDSKMESQRYAELALLERSGAISDLKLQPKYVLQEGFCSRGHKIRSITYIADFSYYFKGQLIVEDVKGERTQVYMLKKKLFLYKYRKDIEDGTLVFKEIKNVEMYKSQEH